MNKVTRILTVISLILTFTGCSSRAKHVDPDLQFVIEQGHQYAHRFLKLDPKRQAMKRYEFLLDVKTREQQLALEVGAEYANAFIIAFNDSARIKVQ